MPDLATSLDGSPDGLTWRLKLRPGLKFSNGAPYTARDVVRHFERILDPTKNQAFAAALGELKEAVAVDDTTVEFRLAYARPRFQRIFSTDNHLIWAMPSEHQDSAGPDLNRRPIGAGPYVMTDWKQDDSITFEKNPNYWNPKSQHLDKIVIRFLPDATARFTAVKTGDIDIFYEPLGKQVNEARNDKTSKVVEYTGTGASTPQYQHVVAAGSMTSGAAGAGLRAGSQCRSSRSLFDGVGRLATSFWGPGSVVELPDVGYPGHMTQRKPGPCCKDYGKPVESRSPGAADARRCRSAHQSFWQKVGIETEIRSIQGGPSCINPVLRGDYQIAFWGGGRAFPTPTSRSTRRSSRRAASITKINDPKLDEAIEAGRRSLDIDVRKKPIAVSARKWRSRCPSCCAPNRSIPPSRKRGFTTFRRCGAVWFG